MTSQTFAPPGAEEETVVQIRERLPEQWVVVIPTQGQYNRVVAGYVLAHDADEGVATEQALAQLGTARPRLKVMWTGEPPIARGEEPCPPKSLSASRLAGTPKTQSMSSPLPT